MLTVETENETKIEDKNGEEMCTALTMSQVKNKVQLLHKYLCSLSGRCLSK